MSDKRFLRVYVREYHLSLSFSVYAKPVWLCDRLEFDCFVARNGVAASVFGVVFFLLLLLLLLHLYAARSV